MSPISQSYFLKIISLNYYANLQFSVFIHTIIQTMLYNKHIEGSWVYTKIVHYPFLIFVASITVFGKTLHILKLSTNEQLGELVFVSIFVYGLVYEKFYCYIQNILEFNSPILKAC